MTKVATNIKVHNDVEDGALIVGDPDIARSQYNDLGAPKRPSTVLGGDHQRKLYTSHAKNFGTPLPKVAINLQHPPKEDVAVKGKAKKAKLSPTKPTVVERDLVVETPVTKDYEPIAKEVNQYTMKFKSPLGEISMEVLDIVESDEGNAILAIFKDDDSVTFKPNPGDIFDITYTAKLGRATESLRVFSPNLLYTLPDSGKKVMILVNAVGSEED